MYFNDCRHKKALECAREAMKEIQLFFEFQHNHQSTNQDMLKSCTLLVKMFDIDKVLGRNSAPKCSFLKVSKIKSINEIMKQLHKCLPLEIREAKSVQDLKNLANNLKWVPYFNIGNIMHMKPIPYQFFNADSFKKLQNHDSIIEIVRYFF